MAEGVPEHLLRRVPRQAPHEQLDRRRRRRPGWHPGALVSCELEPRRRFVPRPRARCPRAGAWRGGGGRGARAAGRRRATRPGPHRLRPAARRAEGARRCGWCSTSPAGVPHSPALAGVLGGRRAGRPDLPGRTRPLGGPRPARGLEHEPVQREPLRPAPIRLAPKVSSRAARRRPRGRCRGVDRRGKPLPHCSWGGRARARAPARPRPPGRERPRQSRPSEGLHVSRGGAVPKVAEAKTLS